MGPCFCRNWGAASLGSRTLKFGIKRYDWGQIEVDIAQVDTIPLFSLTKS